MRLEPYLGTKWKKASFSVAERSVDEGSRTRNFDANELLAFTQAFDKPLGWFFLPPSDDLEVVCPADVSKVVSKIVPPIALRRAASGGALMRLPLRKLKAAVEELEQLTQEEK